MAEKNSQGSMPLFLEDVFDALRAAVQAAGGAKAVSCQLWPAKPADQARKDLLDCLNRDNDRKLCVEEVMAILRMAREAGYHGAKHWIDDALGYQPTLPQDPKIERDRLADELARFTEQSKVLTRAAERLLEPTQRIKVAG
jgi:hypothetical protein